MHSSLVRLQQVFGFLTTVGFTLAVLIALTSYTYTLEPTANIKVTDIAVVKRRSGYYSSRQNEYANIKFDLDADIDSLFNWNTKQVFLYISASYGGDRYPTNEAVIWDKIVPASSTPAQRKISLKNIKAKYNIHDVEGAWNARNASLTLSWNIQPHVGVLVWDSVSGSKSKVFRFPAVKAKNG